MLAQSIVFSILALAVMSYRMANTLTSTQKAFIKKTDDLNADSFFAFPDVHEFKDSYKGFVTPSRGLSHPTIINEFAPIEGFQGPSTKLVDAGSLVNLIINVKEIGHRIPAGFFGIFFEEINHAGTGGLHAELVQNQGFEAGGPNVPSSINPWLPMGSEEQVWLETERCSPFQRNPVALRMDVLCARMKTPECGPGVGVLNSGFWGMNIVKGASYIVSLWMRASGPVKVNVAFVSRGASTTLAHGEVQLNRSAAATWKKHVVQLQANGTDHFGQLALTTKSNVSIWLDQVSAMPAVTFKGHGLRKGLARMLQALKPGFMRFPGGCYVEGDRLANAYRWRQTVGPWEDRPGHFNGVWGYWSNDRLGLFEFLQLCGDINTAPVWVFNNGLSHSDEVPYAMLGPFIKDILDAIEFARGPADSPWGKARAKMGRVAPFPLRHIAVGNEDCSKENYAGSFKRFSKAIKAVYPDMRIISNCDAAHAQNADLFDYHVYTEPESLFALRNTFDAAARTGPKVFVSEYAARGVDVGTGNLRAALAEAAFMMGLERNSDIVEMASYAPLFVNQNDRRWNPDAIVFDSYRHYGTPSYWAQRIFHQSNGATWLHTNASGGALARAVTTSAVLVQGKRGGRSKIIVKAVNFEDVAQTLRISVQGLGAEALLPRASLAVLAGASWAAENSLSRPHEVVPAVRRLRNASASMEISLPGYSLLKLELVMGGAEEDGSRQPASGTAVRVE